MYRTRIKICGITRPDDAVEAQKLGVDALGLNFFQQSSRYISAERAKEITGEVSALTALVGLFVNPEPAQVESVLEKVPLNLLQFHGDEDDKFCNQFQLPWIKALRVRDFQSIGTQVESYPHARGILLDSYVAGEPGGTGKIFDWSSIPAMKSPYVLAGGLTPENVREAIVCARPYAVDVSSGVESAPGIKDADRMRAFVEAVEGADSSVRG